jgi:hypothetical protein
VSIETPKQRGMIAADVIDSLMIWKIGRIPALMIPKAIANPRARSQSFCKCRDSLAELCVAVRCSELNANERCAAHEEVHMRVIESRKEQAATQIDNACVGPREFAHGCVIADGENT